MGCPMPSLGGCWPGSPVCVTYTVAWLEAQGCVAWRHSRAQEAFQRAASDRQAKAAGCLCGLGRRNQLAPFHRLPRLSKMSAGWGRGRRAGKLGTRNLLGVGGWRRPASRTAILASADGVQPGQGEASDYTPDPTGALASPAHPGPHSGFRGALEHVGPWSLLLSALLFYIFFCGGLVVFWWWYLSSSAQETWGRRVRYKDPRMW